MNFPKDSSGPPEVELVSMEKGESNATDGMHGFDDSYQEGNNLEDELNQNMSRNYDFEDQHSMMTDGPNMENHCDFETNPDADMSYDGKIFDNNFASGDPFHNSYQLETQDNEPEDIRKEHFEDTTSGMLRSKNHKHTSSDDALDPNGLTNNNPIKPGSPGSLRDLEFKRVLMSDDIAFIKQEYQRENIEKKQFRKQQFETAARLREFERMKEDYEALYGEFLVKSIKAEKEKQALER